MSNWSEAEEGNVCTAEEDRKWSERVAEHLGIQLTKVSFEREYWQEVFAPSIAMYKDGKTPNPDVLCNRQIKFNHFAEFCKNKLRVPTLATGHYADVRIDTDGTPHLLAACDASKDQTYFLSQISGAILHQVIFPLGHLKKTKVREIAKQIGLPNAEKRDSTGICFIGKRKFSSFLEQYVEPKPGQIYDIETGQIIGTHKGLAFYTLGQRTPTEAGPEKHVFR